MSSKIFQLTTFIIFGAMTNVASACSSTLDCDLGSKCIKPSGSMYGYCMGGMNPGNSYDAEPATDFGGGGGWTCSSNFDCELGYQCAKSGMQGVCIKK